MDIELLGRQNPWWVEEGAIDADPFIEEFDSSPFKWHPPYLDSLNLDEDLVYVVFGPRQIGKTTSFKLLIRNLLRGRKIRPRSILYFNAEEVTPQNPQRLAELIDSYLSWVRAQQTSRLYVLLDEATYIRDWQRGIKILADKGRLRGVTLLATGSHAMGLRRGAERLPGRRGRGMGLDIALLPLNFREYVSTVREELRDKLPQFPGWELRTLLSTAREASLIGTPVASAFESYLRTGGFPRAVRDFVSLREIRPDVYRVYRDGFVGDLGRMGRREPLFRELAQWIIQRRENPFEWSDAARETYVGTHPTVREYVEDSEAAFVWDVFYRLRDMGNPFRAPRSPKRVYFKDPFIFHAVRSWVLGYQNPYRAEEEFLKEPTNYAYLVESLVASHLRRLWRENVFYWRDGGEMDFVVFENGKRRALVEVKYQSKITSENARVLHKWGGGIVLTRNTLNLRERTLYLPVHYFLSLLG